MTDVVEFALPNENCFVKQWNMKVWRESGERGNRLLLLQKMMYCLNWEA